MSRSKNIMVEYGLGHKSSLTMNDIHHHLREVNSKANELVREPHNTRKPNHHAHNLMMRHHFDFEKQHGVKGGAIFSPLTTYISSLSPADLELLKSGGFTEQQFKKLSTEPDGVKKLEAILAGIKMKRGDNKGVIKGDSDSDVEGGGFNPASLLPLLAFL